MRRFWQRLRRGTPRDFVRAGGILCFTAASFFFSRVALAAPTAPSSDDTFLQWLAEKIFALSSVLTQFIVLLIDAVVPLMTFNNFISNPVVNAGWAITRDTVNMFFVVVLIIIAFGTIFGYSKFHWDQQVPRLLFFAIVINFSKTLCGIMIDFGQVIMLTFANALREIAAGNFIQLLGLNQLHSISATSDVLKKVGDGDAAAVNQAFDFLASGVASVFLTLTALTVLLIIVAVLALRIVILWTLVVVAPLTWFVGGAGDIIKSNAYADWWGKFKCMIGIGPILAFFLWLTLAVAGAGNIAANSGFDVAAGSNSAGFVSELLQLDNLFSFIIAIALLLAGLDAAAQWCSSFGAVGKSLGLAKTGVLATTALGLAGKGASLGLKGGTKGAVMAGGALKGAAKYIPLGARASRAWGKVPGRAGMYRALAGAAGATALGKWATKKQGEAQDRAGIARAGRIKAEEKKLDNLSPETVANLGEKFARGGAWSAAGEAEGMAILGKAMSDKRVRKQLRASGALQELWKRYGKKYEDDHRHDASKLDAVNGFKKSNADITGATHLIDKWDDAKSLDDDALKSKAVQDRLKEIKDTKEKMRVVVGKDNMGKDIVEERELNAYEAIQAGRAGDAKRKALTTQEGEKYERMSAAELNRVSVSEVAKEGTPKAIGGAVGAAASAGDSKRAKELIAQMLQKYQGANDDLKKELNQVMDGLDVGLATSSAGIAKYLRNARKSMETQQRRGGEQTARQERKAQIPKFGADQTVEDYVNQSNRTSQSKGDGELTVEVLAEQGKEIESQIKIKTDTAKREYEKARQQLANEMSELNRQLGLAESGVRMAGENVDQDEGVKRIRVQVEEKKRVMDNFQSEDVAQVKQIHEEVKRLEETKKKIQEAKEKIVTK